MEDTAQRVVLSSGRIESVVTLQFFESKTAERKRLEVLGAQKTTKVGQTQENFELIVEEGFLRWWRDIRVHWFGDFASIIKLLAACQDDYRSDFRSARTENAVRSRVLPFF
ncbi:hypothetical protein NL676_026737 [Syzygium grande]|nr:hypothetical protein NL676_026737 [Syzygium grande]